MGVSYVAQLAGSGRVVLVVFVEIVEAVVAVKLLLMGTV